MEDQGQENSGELVQGNEFLAKWRRGKGPRTITEYLFPNLTPDSSSSDETIVVPSEEEAVSYTHLDVYKRQVSALCRARSINHTAPKSGFCTKSLSKSVPAKCTV